LVIDGFRSGAVGFRGFTADRSTEESSRASKTGGKAGVAGDRLRLGGEGSRSKLTDVAETKEDAFACETI
jgi:hypothetical protein